MSYFIDGYKFNTDSFVELNKLVNDLKESSKKLITKRKQKYFITLFLDILMDRSSVSDSLWFMNSHKEISYFENREDVKNIKTMSDLIALHYKEQLPERISVFCHKDYDFMMINNTLNHSRVLLSSSCHELLEENSFSTYSGETGNSEELEEQDKEYYKNLKIELKLQDMAKDEFSEYCDDNELYESSPSYVCYEEIKKRWETFTRNSFYINQYAIQTTIMDEKKDYLEKGIENFGFAKETTISDIVDLIDVKKIKSRIDQLYISYLLTKEPNQKYNKPSDYLKHERELRDSENFEENSNKYFLDKLNTIKKSNKNKLISTYIKDVLY